MCLQKKARDALIRGACQALRNSNTALRNVAETFHGDVHRVSYLSISSGKTHIEIESKSHLVPPAPCGYGKYEGASPNVTGGQ